MDATDVRLHFLIITLGVVFFFVVLVVVILEMANLLYGFRIPTQQFVAL